MIVTNLEKIYDDSFGLWASGLFSAIAGNNSSISFTDQKEIFFEILKKWLDEGKVKFCKPADPLGEVWIAPADEIVGYLRSLWPDAAKDENDEDLNMYFYEIPAIKWLGADGKLYGA